MQRPKQAVVSVVIVLSLILIYSDVHVVGAPAVSAEDIPGILQAAFPTVVQVKAEKEIAKATGGETPSAMQERDDSPNPATPKEPTLRVSPRTASVGAGIIVRDDGRVLTAAHLVDGAQTVTLTFSDGATTPAKVIGIDRLLNIALLSVERNKLPTIRFGDSTKLRVGDPVIGMGHPYGFVNTVHIGIVSGLNRSLPGYGVRGLLQTSVPIAPGFSGGPLLNGAGETIGMFVAMWHQPEWSAPISFAIPSNVLKRALNDLLRKGRVEHPWIGVTVQSSDRPAKGAMLSGISPGGPAAKAGLKPGDVVVTIGDRPVGSAEDFVEAISSLNVGQEVALKIVRDGKETTLKITLGERPQVESGQNPPLTPK